jgi:alkylation response protein AidB-like acyl-CoA dehydrogenase
MTEPSAGSDLASIRTTGRRDARGYVINGAKTFITNGINAASSCSPPAPATTSSHRDIPLFAMERDTPGFTRGAPLEKLGQHFQDTAELFFNEAIIPAEKRIGDEGTGFRQMALNLAQERLSIALGAVAAADGALQQTLAYTTDRQAFGRSIGTFQNSRFRLAECRAEIEVAQAFADRCLHEHIAGTLTG